MVDTNALDDLKPRTTWDKVWFVIFEATLILEEIFLFAAGVWIGLDFLPGFLRSDWHGSSAETWGIMFGFVIFFAGAKAVPFLFTELVEWGIAIVEEVGPDVVKWLRRGRHAKEEMPQDT